MNTDNFIQTSLRLLGVLIEHFAMAGALSFLFFQVIFSFYKLRGFQIPTSLKVICICSAAAFIVILKLFITQSLLLD